ncbi:1-deoxy-D-xylulose-5-phosphate synthase [Streptomyces sp. V2]|uniref:1-deoxy-D-xylulose-5-phosphate synthase n=1 Tax=Streptomyces TaxID=1883 RepID=UPI0006EB8F8C|nr:MULTISPECIES: 1-deoxy-D-xylulose-5-phosphate synthase [Streptomyces]PWG11833.1 1-deoxy-D-xylulose-5-phosphate synthase [Streptomyces sp. V2]
MTQPLTRRVDALTGPSDLRNLTARELDDLAASVRAFLVNKVCATGGHLGPNLGVVELSLALHRVFVSPHDTLIFDTGHQTYVHKLVTGRADDFDTLRRQGGLSGYPSRRESVHDMVENSHASTALSYADGLAKARHLAGQPDRAVVAVIGDGALSGGMALEALNNLGMAPERPVIVVVNDNGRSYGRTHGALATHLTELKSGGALVRRNLFTDLGFVYLGPVDGHSTQEVEEVLRQARALHRTVVVHVMTVKGKGYPPAEQDEADCLHSVGPPTLSTGTPVRAPARSWTSVFGQVLAELASERAELVAVTAAMLRPTGLHSMQQRFPDRVFDVGIAEQHAVSSAAGLAMGGLHPVVAIYATFLNRAFDQILMDVALHRLPVTFVLDRAGITGPDGPSHHGMWDLSLLSMVPGLRIAAPRDTEQLGRLLREAVDCAGPTALRLPKASTGPEIAALTREDGIDILLNSPQRPFQVLLVPVGPLAAAALDAARLLQDQTIGVTVADARWVLPVNPALATLADRHQLVVSVEDGVATGGVGWALAALCRAEGVATPIVPLGLPQSFIAQGSRTALLAEAGLDGAGIVRAVRAALRDILPATATESHDLETAR